MAERLYMSKAAFNELTRRVSPYLPAGAPSVEVQLSMCLAFLGGARCVDVGDVHGVGVTRSGL